MITNNPCVLYLEADYVIDDEFLKRLEQERLAPHRVSVNILSLLVTECFFDDVNAKVGSFVVYGIGWIIQISIKPLHGLLQLFTGNLSSASYGIRILKHFLPVFMSQTLSTPFPTCSHLSFPSSTLHLCVSILLDLIPSHASMSMPVRCSPSRPPAQDS